MPEHDPGRLARYGAAVLAVAVATAARALLTPALDHQFPFATLFFAVLVAAWYGGTGPAVAAVALGAASAAAFLLPPRTFTAGGWDQQIGVAQYLGVGAGIALLGGAMRASRRQARADGDAAHAQRELWRATLAGIGDGVVVTDAGGRVTFLNPVAEHLTGWATAEAAGEPLDRVFRIVNEETRRAVENPALRALKDGRVVGLANHTVLVARDGTERPIDDSAAPVRDAAGAVSGAVLVFRDVTERKRQEDARRELLAVIETSTDLIGLAALDGTIRYFNDAGLRMLGLADPNAARATSLFDFVLPDDLPRVREEMIPAVMRDGRWEGEWRYRHARTGEAVPVSKKVTLIRHPATGEPQAFSTVSRDITAQKRAEDALRRSESRTRAILESITDAFYALGRDWRFTYVNREAERLLGRTRDDLLGKHIWEEFAPAVGTPFEANYARALAEGVAVTFEAFYPPLDGWYEVHAYPSADGLAVYFRDVTARRAADDALRASEARFRELADAMPQVVYVARPDGTTEYVNRRWHEYTGLPEGEPFDPARVIHPDDLPALLRAGEEGRAAGRGFEGEFRLRRHDGAYRWFLTRAVPVPDGGGRPARWYGTSTDIDDRKRAEAALRASEARFAALVDHAPAAIFIKTPGGRYELVNRVFEHLAGATRDRIVGGTDADLFPPDVAARFAAEDGRVLRTGRPEVFEEAFEYGGRGYTFLTAKFLLPDAAGRPGAVCGIATDITARKRAEEAVRAGEERLGLALAAARLGDWSWDAATDVVTLSGRAAEVFGVPPGPHTTWTALQALLHPDDRDRAARAVERAVADGSAYDTEYRVARPDGAEVWVAALGRAQYDPAGRPVGMYGVVRDVTDRKRAEEALREEHRAVETLRAIGGRLAAELDLDKLLQAVTDETVALTGAAFGAFFYNGTDGNGDAFLLYTLSGAPRGAFERFPHPRATAIFEPTFKGAGTVRLDDVTRDPRYGRNVPYSGMPEGHLPVRSYLAVSVRSRSGEVLGGLFFGHPEPGRFTDRHERLAEGVAAQAAVAIDNARLYQRVQESDERFRQLAEAATSVFWVVDPRRPQTLYVSPAYERVWGRPPGTLLDDPPAFLAAVHPDDRGRVAAALDRQAAGEATAEEYRVVRPDGTVRWVWDRGFPIRDAAGAVYRVAGVAEDVTDRRRAEQDARFLADASAALAALVDYRSTLQKVARLAVPGFADWAAVDVAQPDGTLRRLAVAHTDPAKVQLAHDLERRYPPDPAAPHGAYHVLRTGEPEMMADIPDAVLAASARDADHLRAVRDLGLRSYLCVPLAVRGKPLGVLTFVAAESGHRYDETDMAVARDLAHRAAVAIENADLYREVREADQRKDEFLAMLAHELRNPLAPVRNGLQILKMRGDPGTVERAVGMMDRQVTHLVRMVDDLMDVSRVMRGKVELRAEPLDVATAVQRAVETAQPAIDAAGHELAVVLPDEPVRVSGDVVRLTQVLSNLLVNASKYSDRSGRITLAVSREGAEAVVRVRDAGVGIATEQLSRIFDLFAQVDRTINRSQGGLGIGLTLVKRLVELHGGSVEAHSDGPGTGSEFVVRLPVLAGRGAAGGDGDGVATTPGPRRRVLVVDDNVDAAESLAMLLRLADHEVRTAHDGPAGLAAAGEFRPDLILLDIGMPGMTGYEVARRLREMPGFRSTTLAAMTGWGQDEDRRRSKEAGFDHHLVKPVDPAALEGLLGNSAGVR